MPLNNVYFFVFIKEDIWDLKKVFGSFDMKSMCEALKGNGRLFLT